MQLHEAQHRIWTTAREQDTRHCAGRLCTRNGGGDQNDTRKNVAMCLECACHNHRRHPSAPRASHASKARGRRCTSAARRAKLYKTAQASCRRPTMRSSHHARRPSIVDTCKTKAQIRAKGTTERAIHRTTRKMKSVTPKKKVPRENFSHYSLILIEKIIPH